MDKSKHQLTVVDDLIAEPTTADLYTAQFKKTTGYVPQGVPVMKFGMMTRTHFYAGLEAQVKFRGIDGESFLKTIFTPVKRYMRDNNKYTPDHNQKRLTHVEEPKGTGPVAEGEGQPRAGDTPGSLSPVPVHVDVQPEAAPAGGVSVGEVQPSELLGEDE